MDVQFSIYADFGQLVFEANGERFVAGTLARQHGGREAVGIARLGQQLLGLSDIGGLILAIAGNLLQTGGRRGISGRTRSLRREQS